MRKNLKIFRVKLGLSQEKMAEKFGCKRATYSAVETGTRNGTQEFWQAFQRSFDIPSAEMWDMMKNE